MRIRSHAPSQSKPLPRFHSFRFQPRRFRLGGPGRSIAAHAVGSPLQFPFPPAPLNGWQFSRIEDPILCNRGEELRMSRVFGLARFSRIQDESTDFVRTWNKRMGERKASSTVRSGYGNG